ncbi:MAG: response regulator [Actinomycetota bacterium]
MSADVSTDILIVEDHPTMRAAMRAVLEQEGYELREAGDGPAALDQISLRIPDVMFLDLHMPGVTGEEVLRQVKGDPETAGVKVIVVTAQGEEGKRTVLELGADAYFQKPYSPLGLLQAVEDVLRPHDGGHDPQPDETDGNAAVDSGDGDGSEGSATAESDPGYDPLWPGAR